MKARSVALSKTMKDSSISRMSSKLMVMDSQCGSLVVDGVKMSVVESAT